MFALAISDGKHSLFDGLPLKEHGDNNLNLVNLVIEVMPLNRPLNISHGQFVREYPQLSSR